MSLSEKLWLGWFVAGLLWAAWGIGQEVWYWADQIKGNTLSEVAWSLRLPGFLWLTAGIALAGFIVALAVHFVARGKWGI